jgi:hypothetical protein
MNELGRCLYWCCILNGVCCGCCRKRVRQVAMVCQMQQASTKHVGIAFSGVPLGKDVIVCCHGQTETVRLTYEVMMDSTLIEFGWAFVEPPQLDTVML